MSNPNLEFERIIVFHNPTSSKAHDTAAYDEFIKTEGIPQEHIFETSEYWRANQTRLHEVLRAGDLLALRGGDGTHNDFTEARCAEDSKDLVREIPMFLMGGGNGNDAARAFNSWRQRRDYSRLLDRAKLVDYNPVRCVVSNFEGSQTHYAASYVGFNVTGDAANVIDSKTHREKPSRQEAGDGKLLVIDGLAIVDALRKGTEFKVENENEIRQYYERTFGNGPRMAKIGHLPVRFSEPRLYEVDIKQKSIATVVFNLGALTITRSKIVQPTGHYESDPVTFIVQNDIAWQRDGKADYLVAGSQVTISRATDRTLRAVTTRKSV